MRRFASFIFIQLNSRLLLALSRFSCTPLHPTPLHSTTSTTTNFIKSFTPFIYPFETFTTQHDEHDEHATLFQPKKQKKRIQIKKKKIKIKQKKERERETVIKALYLSKPTPADRTSRPSGRGCMHTYTCLERRLRRRGSRLWRRENFCFGRADRLAGWLCPGEGLSLVILSDE